MRSNRCPSSVGYFLCLGFFAALGLAFAGCGGGGGGTTLPAPVPSATIQGSVSGTIVMAIDETGKIVAKDDTAGKTPLPGSSPPKYPFTLTVPSGHRYTIQFIVTDNVTGVETVVPLYEGTVNIFSVGSTGTLDLGFVDTSGATAASDNNILTQPGVTSGGTTPPPTININMDNGYRFIYTRNEPDGSVTAKFNVEVRDPAGTTPVTDRSLIRDVAFFDNAWNSLRLSGAFVLFNGTTIYRGNPLNTPPPALNPSASVDGVLVQGPSGLPAGFYNVTVTDNAGNLHKAQLYFRQPDAVAKPLLSPQTINTDNSITLAWTNPTFPSGKTYSVRLLVLSDDLNADTESDWLLLIIGNQQFESYTIPASFVTSNLAGKSGLKWHVQVRQHDDTIVFPDGRSLATAGTQFAQFYRNISEERTLTLPAPPAGAFSQADLTGTWDIMQFKTGSPGGGWFRVVGEFKDNGALFVPDNTTYQSTVADDSVPNGDQGIIWKIDPDGVITETGDPTASNFHGDMASNKQLIVATVTLLDQSGSPIDKAIRILRKRVPGVSYTNGDLMNKSFADHMIEKGSTINNFAIGWSYGAGTTDSTGQIRLTTVFDEFGPDPTVIPTEVVAQFQVDANGNVSDNLIVQPNIRGGFMTPDKTTIFLVGTQVDTDSLNNVLTSYSLLVVSLVDPNKTFIQSDFAGTHRFHSIFVGQTVPTNGWAYGTMVAGSTGATSITGGTSNGPLSGTDTITLGSDGTFGSAGNTTLHGTLSSTGNLWIATSTGLFGQGAPDYDLLIGMR